MWPFRRAPGDRAARTTAPPEAPRPPAPRHARWSFEPGFEISPGRHVLRRLGGGSRYEVHLAWDERLFAPVVAKVLRPDQVADAHALRELAREARLLQALAHPSLVRGFGAVLAGPHPHLVLEHVEGPTLGRLLRREGPLALAQLLPLALHLLSALHYLACEGIVHLDVKPGNVVMSGPPRLIDLSVARPAGEARALHRAIGTDAYMAPEQCNPPGAGIGPASDVWGAGATLLHAASGRAPFPRAPGAEASGDPRVRFPQLRGEPPPDLAALPPALRELVAAMLHPDPSHRPTAREAAEALEPLAAQVPDHLVRTRRGRLVPARWEPQAAREG